MKVIAKRGVCVGVNKHLKPGESADLDAQTVTFLVSIGAVEVEAEPKAESKHESDASESKPHETKTKHTPDHSSKKEKSS